MEDNGKQDFGSSYDPSYEVIAAAVKLPTNESFFRLLSAIFTSLLTDCV